MWNQFCNARLSQACPSFRLSSRACRHVGIGSFRVAHEARNGGDDLSHSDRPRQDVRRELLDLFVSQRGQLSTMWAPASRISTSARSESPGSRSMPAMASCRTVTARPARSASTTECLTQKLVASPPTSR